MSDLKICRICLRTEVRGYKFSLHQLKSYYEEITGAIVCIDDGLPHWFCYECAMILHKYHKFKEKCSIGQQLLKDMQRRGSISYELVYKINLPPQLSPIIQHANITRHKTFAIKAEIFEDTALNFNNSEKTEVKENINIINDQDSFENNIRGHYHSDSLTNSQDIFENYSYNQESLEMNTHQHKDLHKLPTYNNQQTIKENLKTNTDLQPHSPINLYIDTDQVIELQNEQINPIKYKNLNINIAFNESNKNLNKDVWKRTVLSEEEALKEFRAKTETEEYRKACFKCNDCFACYAKKDSLRRHILNRHSESAGPEECRVCRVKFKWRSHLRMHMANHYIRYECLLCHHIFNIEGSAILHQQVHSDQKRKCLHCGEEFQHVTTYYTHMRTHRSTHVCRRCGEAFVSHAGLKQHYIKMHSLMDMDSDGDEDLDSFCRRCDISFHSRKAYETHLFSSANHTNLNTTHSEELMYSKKIQGKRLKEKITKELRKREGCKTPPLPKKVKMKKKSRIKPTTCHQCGKHFSTQRACRLHHQTEHPRTSFYSNNDRHICELCGASLAPGSVVQHMNSHSLSRIHSCDVCGRQFASGVALKRHMLSHTGDKPYPCTMCDKRFTQSNSMKLHYRTVHLRQPYPNRKKKTARKRTIPEPTSEGELDESREVLDEDIHVEAPQVHKVDDVTQLHTDHVQYLTLN